MNEETKPKTIAELCETYSIAGKAVFKGYETQETKPRESWEKPSFFVRSTYAFHITKNEKTETFAYFCGHSTAREFRIRESEGKSYENENMRKKNAPKLPGVLWSLAQDASFFVNNTALDATYENFADEYGYDTDSRKGLEIFQACQESGNRLQKLLGREAFSELMALVNEGIEE